MIAATPKNAFDKVKTHIQENKKVYIVGGVCLTAGLVGGALIEWSLVASCRSTPTGDSDS